MPVSSATSKEKHDHGEPYFLLTPKAVLVAAVLVEVLHEGRAPVGVVRKLTQPGQGPLRRADHVLAPRYEVT